MKRKEKKKKKLSVNIPLIAVIVLGIVGIGYLIISTARQNDSYPTPSYDPTQPISTNNGQTRVYKSTGLKFTVEIPLNSKVIENLGSVSIEIDKGGISIGRNGTNYDNVKDYVLNSRNNLQDRMVNRKELIINGLETISGNVENQKMYVIYANYNVYLLFTELQELFSDLDQIAQSFRYTP